MFLARGTSARLAAGTAGRRRHRARAAGIGDRLYPTLGNGGYDVWHYDVAWRYPVAAPTTRSPGP